MAIVLKGGEIRVDAQGEGSKGGHIIGHTKSGKPIYLNANHPSHRDFGTEEHHAAYRRHKTLSRKSNNPAKRLYHEEQAKKHGLMASGF